MAKKDRQLAIDQLERISGKLGAIGETVDYTEVAIKALQTEPCVEPTTKVTANVSIPITISLGLPLEDKVDYVAHMIADGLAKKLIPLIDFSLGHDEHRENTLHIYHVFEGSVDVVIKPHNNLDTIKNFLKFTDIGMGEKNDEQRSN